MSEVSTDILLIFVPTILGLSVSSLCPVSREAGSSLKWRPPSWVFGVVWPILYILTGCAWYLAQRKTKSKLLTNILMVAVLALQNYWLVVYSCNRDKLGGAYILMMSWVATLLVYTSMGDCWECQLLLAPLLGWIILAMLMNILEVQELAK